MKLNYMGFIRILALSLILFAPGVVSASDSINWRSYEEGMALSKIEKKKVFLHFYADWCGFCRKMANTTFKDTSLINYLNDNFMPIMVNTDREPQTAGSYGVAGLPTTIFLTEMGEPIFSVPGYIPTLTLMSMLKEINGLNTGG
jgi:thioredoxin-related protein